MIFVKTVLLLLSVVSYSASDPICYCKNGIKSTNSTNASQCECSAPTGDCGDNVAYVPAGDALTYAEATGDCGNVALAEGKESRAVVYAGKSNRAAAYEGDFGVAEIEGGEKNLASIYGSGTAKVIGTNSNGNWVSSSTQGYSFAKDAQGNNVFAKDGCLSSVENGSGNYASCNKGQVSIKNGDSNNVRASNNCSLSVENGSHNDLFCKNGGRASAKNGESNVVVANDDCEAYVENGNGNNVTCNFMNDRAYVIDADDCIIWTWFEILSCSNATNNIAFEDGRDLHCELNPFSAPICYCKNGEKSSNSTNPSQCECSVPTGDCGDNEAYVPEGDDLAYAEATGECGNFALAKGIEARAVIHAGKSNHATAQSDHGVAEIEGGERNEAGTFRSHGTAMVFGNNSKGNNVMTNGGGQATVKNGEGNHVSSIKGCYASVENSTDSLVDCEDEGGYVSVTNGESNTVWTKNGCRAAVENGSDNEVLCGIGGGQASIKNGESNVVKVNKACNASVENGIGNTVTCNFANSRAYVLDADDCSISTWSKLLSCSNDTDGIAFEDGRDVDCEWVPICYCKNGEKLSTSSNPSQCKCSVPTGDCGDNEAYVPEGDALTYAEATGECGNFAHAEGKEGRAVIHAGRLNRAIVYHQSEYGVAEIEGGEGNKAQTSSGTAKVLGTNSKLNNVVAGTLGQAYVTDGENNHINSRNGCWASVENSTSNWVDCTDDGGQISVKNAESNTISTKNGCLASVDSGRDNEVSCKKQGGLASIKNGESNIVVVNSDCKASVENGNDNTVTCNRPNSIAYVVDADDCYIWTKDYMLSCSNDTDGLTLYYGMDRPCVPICYCLNGEKSSNSTNPSQCECSAPTGDCGDNEAYVPKGDTSTYAEANGECGNRAHAEGKAARAVIHAGKSNHAAAFNAKYGVAEIEGGEGNIAHIFDGLGTAKVFGTNSNYNHVWSRNIPLLTNSSIEDGAHSSVKDGEGNSVNAENGCVSSVENGTDNLVTCTWGGGQISVKNGASNNIWIEKGCLASVENGRDNDIACNHAGGQASLKNGDSNVVVVDNVCETSVENGNGNNVTCNFANSHAYVLDANDCTIWTWLDILSCSNDTDGITFEDGKDLDCKNVTSSTP